jgi:hypothetical protein
MKGGSCRAFSGVVYARVCVCVCVCDSKDGCGKANCPLIQQQWAVLERFYRQGKLRAIGVSNYCISCLQCLSQTMQVDLRLTAPPPPPTLPLRSTALSIPCSRKR